MSNTIIGDVMEILACGYNFIHDKDFKLVRPNGMNNYLFIIIRSNAIVEVLGKPVNVAPNSIILIRKGVAHSIFADREPYINDWIEFSLDKQQEEMLYAENMVTDLFFCTPDVFFCSDIINLMQREWLGQGKYKDNNMKAFLKILFNKYYEISHNPSLDKLYYSEIHKIREQIYDSPMSNFTVQTLADEIHLSKSYFHRLYKEYFHTQPISDLILAKIEYAKQLLATTYHSVSDIATLLGYPSDAQFIKQFKKISGITPGKYRKMLEEKPK